MGSWCAISSRPDRLTGLRSQPATPVPSFERAPIDSSGMSSFRLLLTNQLLDTFPNRFGLVRFFPCQALKIVDFAKMTVIGRF